MRVILYRTCFVSESKARLYMQYMDEHNISYSSQADGNNVHIECYGNDDDMREFNKWVLKTFRP